jgi:hypothetical protein
MNTPLKAKSQFTATTLSSGSSKGGQSPPPSSPERDTILPTPQAVRARRGKNQAPRPHQEISPAAQARRAVLAQWRGLDLTPHEIAAKVSAKSTASVMPKVLAEMGLDRRRLEAEVAKVWNHLIDPNVVAHAQPTGMHKGTLFVSVDSSVWLSEIVRYRRKEILERLQHSFGPELIKRISFRAG